MNKTTIILLLFLLPMLGFSQKKATWMLVFEDNFNGTKLDRSLWHSLDGGGVVYEDRYNYSFRNQNVDSFLVENGFVISL